MAKFSQECLDGAKKLLTNFTENDLRDYAQRVFSKSREYPNLSGNAAIKQAIKDVGDEVSQAYFEAAAIKANNTVKFAKRAKDMRDGKANLKETLIKRYKYLGDNIETHQRNALRMLHEHADFTSEELNYMVAAKNDDDIARAIDGQKSTPLAESIAKKHQEYIDSRNTELVKSNAMMLSDLRNDRHFRAIHDVSKILSGGRSLITAALKGAKYSATEARQAWKQYIKPLLDIEKTFKNTKAADMDGNISDTEVDKMLDKIFANITTHKSDIFTKSLVVNDRDAVLKKAEMFFEWKNQQAFMKYNSQYGKGTYFAALQSDMHSASNRIGLAEAYGDSPANMYLDLKGVQQEVDPKSNLWYNTADLYYKQITGANAMVASPSGAAIGASLRAFTGMARLGSLAFQGMSDIAGGIMFANRWGFGFFGPMLDHWMGLFNLIPSESRSYVAGLYKTNVDTHLGFIGRYIDAANLGETSSKASTAFYKWTGTDLLDKGNKTSSMAIMTKNMGNLSRYKYADLPSETKLQMSKYDIGEHEWEMLRGKTKNGMFSTDNVDALTPDEVKQLHNLSDKSETLASYKDSLARRVYSWFDVASENAYLSPNAFTKAWMTFGTQAGTPWGEVTRQMMQFKGYSISFLDRAIYQGFRDAVGAQAKIGFALKLFGATLPISLLSLYLTNLAAGKSMPSWKAMSTPEKYYNSAQLLAPSMSLVTKILNPHTQGKDELGEIFNGATMQTMGNALKGTLNILEGDPKSSLKSFKKAGEGMNPASSFPIISPFMRQAFGDKPYLEPGQKQIYGA